MYMMQAKEIERLNGVYVNILKNSGVEYIGMCCLVVFFFIVRMSSMDSLR